MLIKIWTLDMSGCCISASWLFDGAICNVYTNWVKFMFSVMLTSISCPAVKRTYVIKHTYLWCIWFSLLLDTIAKVFTSTQKSQVRHIFTLLANTVDPNIATRWRQNKRRKSQGRERSWYKHYYPQCNFNMAAPTALQMRGCLRCFTDIIMLYFLANIVAYVACHFADGVEGNISIMQSCQFLK